MKWTEANKYVNDSIQTAQTRTGDDLARQLLSSELRMMLEIHGDLDQLAALTRERRDLQKEYNGIAAAILEQWLIHTTLTKAAHARAEEQHAQIIELHALLIEREKRAAAAEIENQKRWEELNKTFPIKRTGDAETN